MIEKTAATEALSAITKRPKLKLCEVLEVFWFIFEALLVEFAALEAIAVRFEDFGAEFFLDEIDPVLLFSTKTGLVFFADLELITGFLNGDSLFVEIWLFPVRPESSETKGASSVIPASAKAFLMAASFSSLALGRREADFSAFMISLARICNG